MDNYEMNNNKYQNESIEENLIIDQLREAIKEFQKYPTESTLKQINDLVQDLLDQ